MIGTGSQGIRADWHRIAAHRLESPAAITWRGGHSSLELVNLKLERQRAMRPRGLQSIVAASIDENELVVEESDCWVGVPEDS